MDEDVLGALAARKKAEAADAVEPLDDGAISKPLDGVTVTCVRAGVVDGCTAVNSSIDTMRKR